MKSKTIIATLIGLLASACGNGPDVSEYQNEKPQLHISEYMSGNITAWGIIEDYSGKVIERFEVKMVGKWKGNKGTLTEHFVYSDGTTKDRQWNLTKISDNEFTGTAPDVIGEMKGKSAGNAAVMNYVLEVPVKGSTYRFRFDDRMYLLNKTMLVNRAKMKKLGFTVAEMTLFFEKKK